MEFFQYLFWLSRYGYLSILVFFLSVYGCKYTIFALQLRPPSTRNVSNFFISLTVLYLRYKRYNVIFLNTAPYSVLKT